MVSVLVDAKYRKSIWCKKLLSSLTYQLRFKRIPFCEIVDACPAKTETVFIIAADYEWTRSVIKQLNDSKIKPILICNQLGYMSGLIYNSVCSDLNGSAKDLLDQLKTNGKTNIAIYGVNTNSISDIGRVDGFLSWKEENFDTMQVFVNHGSLQKCYADFEKQLEKFDAVICSNDFAAISLVRNLKKNHPEILKKLTVIGCAKTPLSEYYTDYITSLNMNFEQYGKAAVSIYECMQKNPYISNMTISVKWTLSELRESTAPTDTALHLCDSEDAFYNDAVLREMLIVDNYLSLSNSTDRKIIDSLINGLTLNEVSEKCFLTEGGIKYRIKRLVSESGAEDKNEMLTYIKKYTITNCDRAV